MKTLVIGASTNKERYSYKAIHSLVDKSHQVVAIGSKKGMAFDIPIETEKLDFQAIDTITLYLNPIAQEDPALLGFLPYLGYQVAPAASCR